jgi:hypothetical protein
MNTTAAAYTLRERATVPATRGISAIVEAQLSGLPAIEVDEQSGRP